MGNESQTKTNQTSSQTDQNDLHLSPSDTDTSMQRNANADEAHAFARDLGMNPDDPQSMIIELQNAGTEGSKVDEALLAVTRTSNPDSTNQDGEPQPTKQVSESQTHQDPNVQEAQLVLNEDENADGEPIPHLSSGEDSDEVGSDTSLRSSNTSPAMGADNQAHSASETEVNIAFTSMKQKEFAHAVAKGRKYLGQAKAAAKKENEKDQIPDSEDPQTPSEEEQSNHSSESQDAAAPQADWWEEEGALDYVPGKGAKNITKTIAAGAGAGLAIKDGYDAGNLIGGKDLSPSGKKADTVSIIMSVAVPLILGGLLAYKMYTAFKKENSITAYAPHVPEMISVLSTIAESVITIASKETQSSKNAINALAPVKSFCAILTAFIQVYQNNTTMKKLQSRIQEEKSELGIDKDSPGGAKEELYKPLIDNLEMKNRIQIPKIIALAGKNASEIAFAVEYAKNPKSKATMASKLAALGFSAVNYGIDAVNADMHKEWGGITPQEMNLYKSHVRNFSDLFHPAKGYYIGIPEEDNDPAAISMDAPVDVKLTAMKKYQEVQADLEAIGVTARELNKAGSKKDQDSAIASALGL